MNVVESICIDSTPCRKTVILGDMSRRRYRLTSKVWLYPGMAGWHFIPVPKKESADIKKKFGARARGWGSLPVTVTIGKTSWSTSIFPDTKAGAYLLPLKAAVRKKEGIERGDTILFIISIGA